MRSARLTVIAERWLFLRLHPSGMLAGENNSSGEILMTNHLLSLGRSLVLGGLLMTAWTWGNGQDTPSKEPSGNTPSSQSDNTQTDNTKMNQRDRNANEPTADQQKSNTSDRDMTKQIRQAIEKDKSISTYGHNVKVITQNGMVTLKGPVRSEEEKKAIAEKAAEVAGADKVTDEMDVKPKQ
jgi:hypothetical protein